MAGNPAVACGVVYIYSADRHIYAFGTEYFIPEGLSIEVVLLLSTAVAVVCFSRFNKRSKWKKRQHNDSFTWAWNAATANVKARREGATHNRRGGSHVRAFFLLPERVLKGFKRSHFRQEENNLVAMNCRDIALALL